MKHEHKSYVFKGDVFPPSEEEPNAPDTPVINMEPVDGELSILKDGMLYFEFRPGTPMESVYDMVSFLNDKLAFVSYTKISD